jgi:hypothetical protein
MSYPSEAYQLGMPLQTYQTGRPVLFQRAVNGVLALLVGSIFVALAVFVHPVFVLVGGLLIARAGVSFVRLQHDRQVSILLAPEGVVRIRANEVQALHWEEIAEIRIGLGLGYRLIYHYHITSRDGAGRKLSFSIPADLEFGDMIQHEYARRMSDNFIDAFANGETLTFGKVTVNRFGVFAGRHHLNWQVLQDIKIGKLRILAYYNGKWRQLGLISDIPNVVLFVITLKFILTMDL